MLTNFKIDQAATFVGVALLSCAPKTRFGERDVQETTKDGTPKWEVQVVASFRSQFGDTQNEVLKIGVAAVRDPGEGVAPYTPVQLVGFEIGVMEKTRKNPTTGEEKVIGLQVWYRAAGVSPLARAAAKQAAA